MMRVSVVLQILPITNNAVVSAPVPVSLCLCKGAPVSVCESRLCGRESWVLGPHRARRPDASPPSILSLADGMAASCAGLDSNEKFFYVVIP